MEGMAKIVLHGQLNTRVLTTCINTIIDHAYLVTTLTIWKQERILQSHEGRMQRRNLLQLPRSSLYYYITLKSVQREITHNKHG
jgi:hypothetical protein